jgi:membrane protein implicated in regulation of membrane protease activity
MLIVALVMAVIGLAALVTAVVTSNEIIAWVCIGASVIGVILLIVDALRERQRRDTTPAEDEEDAAAPAAKESESEDSETSQ